MPATARMGVLAAAIEAGLSPAPARAHSISVKLLADSSRATFKADAPPRAIVGNTPGDGVTLVLEVSTDLQLETDPTFVRP